MTAPLSDPLAPRRSSAFLLHLGVIYSALLKSAARDRLSLGWAIVFPLLLLIGLGIAFTSQTYRAQLLVGVLLISLVNFVFNGAPFEVLRQRNSGVYKLLRATLYSIPRFITALALARASVALVCLAAVMGVGLLFTGVQLAWSDVLTAFPVMLLGILCFSLLGIVVGNLANEDAQAAALNNVVTLPMLFLSEVFYSLQRAPAWIQALSEVLPFQNMLVLLRATLLHSGEAWLRPMLVVGAYTLLFLLLAVITFRWDSEGSREK